MNPNESSSNTTGLFKIKPFAANNKALAYFGNKTIENEKIEEIDQNSVKLEEGVFSDHASIACRLLLLSSTGNFPLGAFCWNISNWPWHAYFDQSFNSLPNVPFSKTHMVELLSGEDGKVLRDEANDPIFTPRFLEWVKNKYSVQCDIVLDVMNTLPIAFIQEANKAFIEEFNKKAKEQGKTFQVISPVLPESNFRDAGIITVDTSVLNIADSKCELIQFYVLSKDNTMICKDYKPTPNTYDPTVRRIIFNLVSAKVSPRECLQLVGTDKQLTTDDKIGIVSLHLPGCAEQCPLPVIRKVMKRIRTDKFFDDCKFVLFGGDCNTPKMNIDYVIREQLHAGKEIVILENKYDTHASTACQVGSYDHIGYRKCSDDFDIKIELYDTPLDEPSRALVRSLNSAKIANGNQAVEATNYSGDSWYYKHSW